MQEAPPAIARYWDVFPKEIRVSPTLNPVRIPLSIRGELSGAPVFESANPLVSTVSDTGRVELG